MNDASMVESTAMVQSSEEEPSRVEETPFFADSKEDIGEVVEEFFQLEDDLN